MAPFENVLKRKFGKGHHKILPPLITSPMLHPPKPPNPQTIHPNLQCHQGLVDLSKIPVLLRRHVPRLVVPLRPGQVHETEATSTFQLKDTHRLGKFNFCQ